MVMVVVVIVMAMMVVIMVVMVMVVVAAMVSDMTSPHPRTQSGCCVSAPPAAPFASAVCGMTSGRAERPEGQGRVTVRVRG